MAVLLRRRPLDSLPPVVCPAASPIAGVSSFDGGVVCGVMRNDRAKEEGWHADGTAFNPFQLAVARDGSDGVLLSVKGDPSTIERLCCGDGIPVDHAGDVVDGRGRHVGRESYTYCPVWQAEKQRLWDLRDGLVEEEAEESFASYESPAHREAAEAEDPWLAAARDVKLLAS